MTFPESCSGVTDTPNMASYNSRMPAGLKRFYGRGGLHFITASCYQRRPLLGSEHRRDLFLRVLEHVRQRYGFVVIGYVVMPEHFHLLISEPQKADPSVVVQALKLGVVRRLARTLEFFEEPSPKHFWQRRFYDFNVWSSSKIREKLRYMHRNPVKRGLVESPDLWAWSSFRAYAYGEQSAVRVNDWSSVKTNKDAA